MKKRPGSAVPYGPPIREAVAQGDIARFRSLLKTVECSLEELAKLDSETLIKGDARSADPSEYEEIRKAVISLAEAVKTLK